MEDTVAVVDANSYQSTGDGPRGITVNESADVSKMYLNIGQLLVIPHPVVPVVM